MGDYDWLISRNNDLEADLYNKAIRIRDLEEEQKKANKEISDLKSFIINNNLSRSYRLYLKDKGVK